MTVDRMAAITRSIGALVGQAVYVGVPQTKAPREGEPMNNATIGYIMEKGSPAANIPARPHLVPGVKSVRSDVAGELGAAAKSALSGDTGAVTTGLNRAGITAMNAVRSKISEGIPPPLADSTLRARARRAGKGKGVALSKGAKAELASRDAGNAPSTASAKPLIDTAQYRNSITYVVR